MPTRTPTASGDCLYGLTWSGAIGDSYSLDENCDVVGVSQVVIEVLPVSQRVEEEPGLSHSWVLPRRPSPSIDSVQT